MDKKLSEQNKPEGVGTKQTNAFGSKGVVVQVLEDGAYPTDTEGNRAEVAIGRTDAPNYNPLGIVSMESLSTSAAMIKPGEYDPEAMVRHFEDRKRALLEEYGIGDIRCHNCNTDIAGDLFKALFGLPTEQPAPLSLADLENEHRKANLTVAKTINPIGVRSRNARYDARTTAFIKDDPNLVVIQFAEVAFDVVQIFTNQTLEKFIEERGKLHPSFDGMDSAGDSVLSGDLFGAMSLSHVHERLPMDNGHFKRFARYRFNYATLETKLTEIDGVEVEQLVRMAVYDNTSHRTLIDGLYKEDGGKLIMSYNKKLAVAYYDLEKGDRRFIMKPGHFG